MDISEKKIFKITKKQKQFNAGAAGGTASGFQTGGVQMGIRPGYPRIR